MNLIPVQPKTLLQTIDEAILAATDMTMKARLRHLHHDLEAAIARFAYHPTAENLTHVNGLRAHADRIMGLIVEKGIA